MNRLDQSQGSEFANIHKPRTTDHKQTSQLYDKALPCENRVNWVPAGIVASFIIGQANSSDTAEAINFSDSMKRSTNTVRTTFRWRATRDTSCLKNELCYSYQAKLIGCDTTLCLTRGTLQTTCC